ncbi:hypothetical protein [Ensifer sp. ENS01]|uniref:hypothetical protein n=1 Tax=Ensifer sp. ENS01 TaxID=2769293 RepID=UPI00177B6C4B|nr:hypothetical protein [Ensifer sp. ENS01]MBD9493187.1 hypothetical protein [Ensifer sp. ENS01]
MTSQDTYIATETYNAALDQLEAIARTFDAAAPDMTRTAIIQVLGEELGVWSDECRKAPEAITPRLVA